MPKGVAQWVTPASKEEVDEESEVIKAFTEYLISNGCQDPDVEYIYGTLAKRRDIIDKAVKNGANLKITYEEIVDRYEKELEQFHKQNKVN